MTNRNCRPFAIGFLTIMLGALSARSAQLDIKPQPLTSKHGPWMIQVTVLRPTQNLEAAERLAAQLVSELRSKGIPAYFVSRQIAHNEKPNRKADVVVLAGNYKSVDSKVATRTLEWIQLLSNTPTSKVLSKSSRKEHPFENAFLRLNPLTDAIDAK